MTATDTPSHTNRIKTRLPDEFRNGHSGNDALATLLGVFSIGLGLAETLAPRRFAEAIVGSSRVDLQACKLEYSIVSPK